ncbi:MAG: hypothetical protein HON78_02590 [Legionellales bacterium]|nr:hypothetical protein [Legionellales bacterium]
MPYKTYKLMDNKTLGRSNLASYTSNFFTGDIYRDTERYLRFNHSRDGLVVNDINAIPTRHTAEEQENSCKKLKGVFEQVIPDSGLVSAAEKAQEQTYTASFTQTHINYNDETYMCHEPHEEFIYSFSTGSDESFTFTTLRKEVISKLKIFGDTPGILLGENGEIKDYDLTDPPPDEKPIYTFTDKTDVTFRWLDLDVIKTKVDNQPKASSLDGFNGFSADITNGNETLLEENFKKMTKLLNELEGVGTIDGLTQYITENCSAVKDYGKSLKEGLDEKRESGEFSLYFKKEDMAVIGAKEVDASELTPQVKVLEEAPTSAEGEEVPVAVALVEAEPAEALKIEEPKFISKEEAAKLKENKQKDKFIEFKFMKDENGVVLPLFFLNENLTRENHLRMSPKGKIQMAFQDEIKRETYFQIDDRLDFVNKEFGIKKEGKKAVGLDFVSDKPCYSDVAHIAKTIELICNVWDEHRPDNLLLLGDANDQIKRQIEELLEYKIEPLMAKIEFKQDMASINVLSESLGKVSNTLAKGKNLELKDKVDEKIKTLETYKNLNNEVSSNKVKKFASYTISLTSAAAMIAIPLVVIFPPALALLAVIVPAICAITSIVSADKSFEYQYKESKAKSALGGEGLSVSSEGHSSSLKSGSINKFPKGPGQEQLNNTRLGFIPENSSGNSDHPNLESKNGSLKP